MGIFFIPASGLRYSSDSQLDYVSSLGRYWSAASSAATYGYFLGFHSSNVSPQNTISRPYGYSVRPVQE